MSSSELINRCPVGEAQHEFEFDFAHKPEAPKASVPEVVMARLAAERHALANKVQALTGFMEASPVFRGLSREEQRDLDLQSSFMRGYLQVLDRRIARYS